jgi:hypothetical protein
MPVSRYVGSHGYGDVWHVVPRCNDDQVQNHNYEHYSMVIVMYTLLLFTSFLAYFYYTDNTTC